MISDHTQNMAKDDRLRIPSLGEWYEDLLRVDSAITGNSEPVQAASLLRAKLKERELIIEKRVRYLAAKRGITYEDMWLQILQGQYQKLTQDEINALESIVLFKDE
ncbi:hypothetical protein ACQ4M3_08055 [Leptolyngbya sp. AN03gr2]|uniref:hypothetical protein n=1 Tax=unclassified Leptolyngbya TaxID=2650499 RepID=UPI003D32118B